MVTIAERLQPGFAWVRRKAVAAVGSAKDFVEKHPTAAKVAGVAALIGTGGLAGGLPVACGVGLTLGAAARAPQELMKHNHGKAAAALVAIGTFPVTGFVGAAICAGTAAAAVAGIDRETRNRCLPPSLQAPEIVDWAPLLEKTSATAHEGLMGAETLGIKPKDPGAHRRAIDRVEPPSPQDGRDLPDALVPAERALGTNWNQKLEEGFAPLARQFTTVNVFGAMLKWAGIPLSDEDRIFQIAGQIETGVEKRSIWEIFNAEWKELSLLQKMKAGIAYLILFQTGLMHRVVDTLVRHAFGTIGKVINVPTDAARVRLFHTLLTEGSGILAREWTAAGEFVKQTDHPRLKGRTLADYRKLAAEESYGFELEALCKKGAQGLVNHFPRIPFFESFHRIPAIGALSRSLESLLNRLIQRILRTAILPQALQAAVERSEDAAQSHELKLRIKATERLTEMAEQLRRQQIERRSRKPTPLAISPVDRKKAAAFVDHLMNAFRLNGNETVPKVAPILTASPHSWVDRKIEGILRGALLTGVDQLFENFSRMAESRELAARTMESCQALFSEDPIDPSRLADRYKEAQARFDAVVSDLVSKMIDRAIEEFEDPGEDPLLSVQELFERTKEITQETLRAFNSITSTLPDKIERGENVQQELADFFQTMREFALSTKMRGDIEKLKEEHKQPLWIALTSSYQVMEKMAEAALRLQGAQGKFSSHRGTEEALRQIRSLMLAASREASPSSSINLLSPLVGRVAKEVGGPVAARLADDERVMKRAAGAIDLEQKRIGGCKLLFDGKEALLAQWESYQSRPLTLSRLFPLQTNERFRTAVRSALESFPEEERKTLERLIGTGSSLRANWAQITEIIARIRKGAEATERTLRAGLHERIEAASAWAQTAADAYQEKGNLNQTEMEAEAALIQQQLTETSRLAEQAALPPASFNMSRLARAGWRAIPKSGKDWAKGNVRPQIDRLAAKARFMVTDPLLLRQLFTRAIGACA